MRAVRLAARRAVARLRPLALLGMRRSKTPEASRLLTVSTTCLLALHAVALSALVRCVAARRPLAAAVVVLCRRQNANIKLN